MAYQFEVTGESRQAQRSIEALDRKVAKLTEQNAQLARAARQSAKAAVDAGKQQGSALSQGIADVKSMAMGYAGLTGAIDLTKRALEFMRQESEKAVQSVEKLSEPRRRLSQIALSSQDLQQLEDVSDQLAAKYAVDQPLVREVVFSARSEGFEETVDDVVRAGKVVGQQAAATVAGQVPGLFPGQELSPMQAINAALVAAAESRLNFEQLARVLPGAAEGGQLAGATPAETMATLSVAASRFKTGETTADRIKAFATKVGLPSTDERIREKGIIEAVKGLERMPAEDRADFLGESQELNTAFKILSQELPTIEKRLVQVQQAIEKTGTAQSAVNQRLAFQYDPRTERGREALAELRKGQQEIQRDITRRRFEAAPAAERGATAEAMMTALQERDASVTEKMVAQAVGKAGETVQLAPEHINILQGAITATAENILKPWTLLTGEHRKILGAAAEARKDTMESRALGAERPAPQEPTQQPAQQPQRPTLPLPPAPRFSIDDMLHTPLESKPDEVSQHLSFEGMLSGYRKEAAQIIEGGRQVTRERFDELELARQGIQQYIQDALAEPAQSQYRLPDLQQVQGELERRRQQMAAVPVEQIIGQAAPPAAAIERPVAPLDLTEQQRAVPPIDQVIVGEDGAAVINRPIAPLDLAERRRAAPPIGQVVVGEDGAAVIDRPMGPLDLAERQRAIPPIGQVIGPMEDAPAIQRPIAAMDLRDAFAQALRRPVDQVAGPIEDDPAAIRRPMGPLDLTERQRAAPPIDQVIVGDDGAAALERPVVPLDPDAVPLDLDARPVGQASSLPIDPRKPRTEEDKAVERFAQATLPPAPRRLPDDRPEAVQQPAAAAMQVLPSLQAAASPELLEAIKENTQSLKALPRLIQQTRTQPLTNAARRQVQVPLE